MSERFEESWDNTENLLGVVLYKDEEPAEPDEYGDGEEFFSTEEDFEKRMRVVLRPGVYKTCRLWKFQGDWNPIGGLLSLNDFLDD